IALKQRNVPDELITALIQRGAEVRNQMAQGAEAPPPNTSQAVTAPFTPPENETPAYADYGYTYYPYYGWSPYNNWWYNYSYPWAWTWYSPLCFGYYGYHY